MLAAGIGLWSDIISVSPSQPALVSCAEVTQFPQGPPYAVAYGYTTSVSYESGISTSPSASDRSTRPADNTDADETSDDTSRSTRTVVSEGPDGPTTTVEVVDATASGAADKVFELGASCRLQLAVGLVVMAMSCCNLV